MLPLELSAILLTCIKQKSVLKTNFGLLFEWSLKTDFTVISDTDECILASSANPDDRLHFTEMSYNIENLYVAIYSMGLNVTQPVFRLSDKVRLKPVSSA